MDSSAFRVVGPLISVLFWVSAAAALTVPALLGYILYLQATTPDWQREAIERGYALHCPDTGAFAWKGECEND